jgi:hypothetical protein
MVEKDNKSHAGPVDERYRKKRRGIEQIFSPESRLADSSKISVSRSGHFQLETCRYSTGPKTWNYSRGIVTRIADGQIIADVKRNFGHFWHAWVQHASGSEYLLCGEDYQGYSVINLTTGASRVYFPEVGYYGGGFCWTAAYPSPDTQILAVDGCIWAAAYEIVFLDFRNPDDLPLRELARVENIVDVCDGWTDNETFVLKREIEVRATDGVPCDSLSEEEQSALGASPGLVAYRTETLRYKRPDLPGLA